MSLRARIAALLGGTQGTPGALDLEGRPARVLGDPHALPPLERAGELVDAPRPDVEQVLVSDLGQAGVRETLAAIQGGGRRFHLVVAPGATLTVNARGALAIVTARRALDGLSRVPGARPLAQAWGLRLDLPRPSLRATLEATRLAAALPAARALPAGALSIAHLTGRLGPGGAERQLVYLARAQRGEGHGVSVTTLTPIAGEDAHYAPDLRDAGVDASALELLPPWRAADLGGTPLEPLLEGHAARELLAPLIRRLRARRPDVLHAWLDEANCVGGLAGLVAGVPRIVLSTRNLNPSRIPRLYRPWYREAYALLARSPRVVLVANSRAGAEDYARWCGVDVGRFRVIENGVPVAALRPCREPEARAEARRRLGYPPDAFLVAGVFRLAPMKRPDDWLAALARARQAIPGLRAFHAGAGPLAEAFRRDAQRRGLGDALRILGQEPDPFAHLRLADACLLTSEAEGCPNVSLESQALEVPMLVSSDPGAAETVAHEGTGLVCPLGDVEAFAARLVELAQDPARVRTLGQAGRARVEARYSVEAMVARTLSAYRGAP